MALSSRIALVAFCLSPCAASAASDLASTCHASSSYDLGIGVDSLIFDRVEPAPRRIELRDGHLRSDGVAVPLNAEDSDRLALFEREVRDALPKARQIAVNGVDIAVAAVRAETAGLQLGADAQAELDDVLARRAADLKRRIAVSRSTHDWQGDAFDRYADDLAGDIVPIIAADLGQQAIAAAVGGDLDAAAALRDRAAHLARDARPRLERRMQALRPQIQALCPLLDRLAELQRGVRGAGGRPLDLLEIAAK